MSLLNPLSPLEVTGWWAIVALGALAGGFLILLFELREVRRGSRSWTAHANGDGELIILSFTKLWWWILPGSAILLAGLILGTMSSK
ncbi:MAG: hypothetical protein WAV93_13645 [Bacteroidales bacterium]